MATTLKTLVLKTATVTSVKLAAPADRIGLGRSVVQYPANVLSPGHSMPPRADSDSNRGRDVPGTTAHRWPGSFSSLKPSRSESRVRFPAVFVDCVRIRDLQSLDSRAEGQAASTREAPPTAAAAK
jgi:hypothetical protein